MVKVSFPTRTYSNNQQKRTGNKTPLTNMDALCEQIDKVLVQFMDTLSDLYKEQDKLDTSMKAGYLNISRARYNMGVRSVGIQQCDENKMNALVKVSYEDNQFILMDTNNLERQLQDLDLNDDQNKSVLRKRTTVNQEDSESKYVGMTNKAYVEEIGLKDMKKSSSSDPLKWFGVLVPQALRQSQTEFKNSVNTVVTVANLKTKLISLQKEYEDLLRQKKEMAD